MTTTAKLKDERSTQAVGADIASRKPTNYRAGPHPAGSLSAVTVRDHEAPSMAPHVNAEFFNNDVAHAGDIIERVLAKGSEARADILRFEDLLRCVPVDFRVDAHTGDDYLVWRWLKDADAWRLVYSTYDVLRNPDRDYVDEVVAADAPLLHRVRAQQMLPLLLSELERLVFSDSVRPHSSSEPDHLRSNIQELLTIVAAARERRWSARVDASPEASADNSR